MYQLISDKMFGKTSSQFRKQQKQMRDIKEGRRDPPCRGQPAETKEEVIEVKNVVEPDYRSPERLEPISEKSGLSPDKLSLMSKKKGMFHYMPPTMKVYIYLSLRLTEYS